MAPCFQRDPAVGTGGFLLAAYDYVVKHQNKTLDKDQKKHLRTKFVKGADIVPNMARLCIRNLYLHGIDADPCPIKSGMDSPPRKSPGRKRCGFTTCGRTGTSRKRLTRCSVPIWTNSWAAIAPPSGICGNQRGAKRVLQAAGGLSTTTT